MIISPLIPRFPEINSGCLARVKYFQGTLNVTIHLDKMDSVTAVSLDLQDIPDLLDARVLRDDKSYICGLASTLWKQDRIVEDNL